MDANFVEFKKERYPCSMAAGNTRVTFAKNGSRGTIREHFTELRVHRVALPFVA